MNYDELNKLPVDGNLPDLTVVEEPKELQFDEQQ